MVVIWWWLWKEKPRLCAPMSSARVLAAPLSQFGTPGPFPLEEEFIAFAVVAVRPTVWTPKFRAVALLLLATYITSLLTELSSHCGGLYVFKNASWYPLDFGFKKTKVSDWQFLMNPNYSNHQVLPAVLQGVWKCWGWEGPASGAGWHNTLSLVTSTGCCLRGPIFYSKSKVLYYLVKKHEQLIPKDLVLALLGHWWYAFFLSSFKKIKCDHSCFVIL